jgi:hypothetical protein
LSFSPNRHNVIKLREMTLKGYHYYRKIDTLSFLKPLKGDIIFLSHNGLYNNHTPRP